MELAIGFLLGILTGILAWRAKALNRSGAWAAAISGGLIFGLGGVMWALLLLSFFISSSALSRAFTQRKAALNEKFSKGGQRDWEQVLANGGLGAVLVLIHTWLPGEIWPWVAFAGAMAAVNADTWATELGVLNPTPPKLITNGKSVERGTSGGISLTGSFAALAGAALIGSLAALFSKWLYPSLPNYLALLTSITLSGIAGSFFDSLLGATVQAIYYCPDCQKETERHPRHTCGAQTEQMRGFSWLNNDAVNFAASLVGALTAVGIWTLWGGS